MVAAPATAVDVLDQLKTALSIVASLGDGAVNVPGLRAAASAAVVIIEIAQTVTKNKEDAVEVAKNAAERTSSLLDAFKGKSKHDMPLDLLQDIERYAEWVLASLDYSTDHASLRKLELVQKILAKHTARTGIWRRVVSRFSNRDEINRCKDILNESFQVFEVSLTLKLHTRLPDLLNQLQSCIIAQTKPVQPKLSVIRREELYLCGYLRLDGSVLSADHNGKSVVVKKYGRDKKRWAADLDAWLHSDAWQPHYLQIIGQSDESAYSLHLVFQDPGVSVQTYIEHELCRAGVKKCTLDVLTMVIQFASVAIASGLLRKDRGGCKIDTADIYLRSTSSRTMNGLNFVLADFEPSHFYDSTAKDAKIKSDGWGTFVYLITKAITGNISKPNYVIGLYGETGPTVTRIFRFLIHFLAAFPYHQDRRYDGLDQMFRKLTQETKVVQDDIELLVRGSNNPLLDSMQRYSSSLCAVWDLWDLLPMTPGDLGVMVPGEDPKRPCFQKIGNVADKINEWSSDHGLTLPVSTTYPEFAEQQYIPSDANLSCWSSEAVDASTIRHSLRPGSAQPGTLKFGYSRARRIFRLGDSWNYNASWSYLRHLQETGELDALATEHNIHPSDIMLIFSTSESKGYTHIILKTAERPYRLLNEVGAKDGVLYYFENLVAAEGELHGYWSASEQPGDPLWGASPRALGTEWGWEHSDEGFKVEIARKGPVQHIRYVSM
ncbi:hypothetical protein B0H16DRAFT_1529436 [Mycena metata]|uniref:Uncharacterized protein n=1 Tax=Mycena metata TaxID=1033252 RepID=A0AAD7JHA7_9AGAR|nr:hypothetical protein B0H16DRAFT_1529436 [Mycena metata]